MESLFRIIVFVCLLSLSATSQSIIKTLPGFDGDLPFTLETGYIGVGEEKQVQYFYYIVESQRDPLHDPLIFYLTGGPGCSALYPLLYQFGPLQFNFEVSRRTKNGTLELNPNAWTKGASIIFLDLPAGSGFSYGKTFEASRSSDSLLTIHSYEFLRQWLVQHPSFLNNPLYIGGVSYMGLIVPIVTLEVYRGNERGDHPQMNIKGCIVISPITHKLIEFNSRFEYAYRLAFISDEIYESTKKACRGNYLYYGLEKNSLCYKNLQRVDECTNDINLSNILEPLCDAANPKPNCREANYVFINKWANDKDVQKALHVREGTVETWVRINDTIHYYVYKNDTVAYSYDLFSGIEYHQELTTRDCKVLLVCGDHDMTSPHMGTEEWIKSLNLPIRSSWRPWFVDDQIAGYEVLYGMNKYSLKYATVKGSGHSTFVYKPVETWALMDKWFSTHTSSSDS